MPLLSFDMGANDLRGHSPEEMARKAARDDRRGSYQLRINWHTVPAPPERGDGNRNHDGFSST